MTSVFQSNRPVTIVGGGDVGPEDLSLALSIAPTCVAADGGSIVALAAGIELEAVIGDFDSLNASVLAQVPVERQHHISEQNSTDFDKCLRNVETPVVVGVGFLGGRVDHQMAAMHTLLCVLIVHVCCWVRMKLCFIVLRKWNCRRARVISYRCFLCLR